MPRRQLSDHSQKVRTRLDAPDDANGGIVLVRLEVNPGRGVELGAPSAPVLPLVERQMHEHRSCVGGAVHHPPNTWPATRHPVQALLDQVLRFCEVPGDQEGGAQKRLGRFGDELVELDPGLALTPTSVHHLLQPPPRSKGCLPARKSRKAEEAEKA